MGRRQKRRTHVRHQESMDSSVPKSMVMKMTDPRRKPTKALAQLVRDFRQVMQPHTAARLRERRSNKLKDYLVMAGPLGVSHFFIFTQSDSGGATLRIAKTPRGPTLYFDIEAYTLNKDIQRSQTRPHALNSHELGHPPVLVLNNFSTDRTSDKDSLLTSIFQNMLPSIQVDSSTQLQSVTRCLLIERDANDPDRFELRHYAVITRPVSASRAIKKLVAAAHGQRDVPALGHLESINDFVADPGLSESEGEDEVLPGSGLSGTTAGAKVRTAVKLVETGPRMTLRLMKIEDGLCQGKTLWHGRKQLPASQAKALEARHRERDAQRARRRAQQEANVSRKRETTTRSQRGRDRAAERAAQDAESHESDSTGSVSDGEYRQDISQMNDYELDAEHAAMDMDSDSE